MLCGRRHEKDVAAAEGWVMDLPGPCFCAHCSRSHWKAVLTNHFNSEQRSRKILNGKVAIGPGTARTDRLDAEAKNINLDALLELCRKAFCKNREPMAKSKRQI